MSKKLQVALQVSADFNAARRETKALKQELAEVSSTAEKANLVQSSISQKANVTSGSIRKLQQQHSELAKSISAINEANDLSFGRDQFDEYGGVVDKVAETLKNTEENAVNLNNAANQVIPSLAKLAATVGAAQLGINLVDAIDEWGQYDVRIKMATDSEAEYIKVKQRLLETSNNTFRPLQESQELFIRTSGAIKALGYNTSEMLDITDSFSYLLVTNAASSDKAQSALNAYSKSITKNKVEADAWESIVTAMPTIITSIARASGKTEAEIRSLGTEGTLALSDLNQGLLQTVDTNKELAASMDNTRKDALQALSNNFTTLVGEFNKTHQVTQTLSSGIILLADNIGIVTGATAALVAGALTKYLITVALAAGANAKALYQQITATGTAVQAERVRTGTLLEVARANVLVTTTELAAAEAALAAATASGASASVLAAAHARVASAKLASITVTEALIVAETQHARSMAGSALTATALKSALFGPVGLAIGVTAVVGGFLMMSSSADAAVESLEEQCKTVADLAAEYEKLDKTQQRIAVREAIQKQQEMTQAYKNQQSELANLIEISTRSSAVSSEQREKALQLVESYKLGKISAYELTAEYQKLNTVKAAFRVQADKVAVATNKAQQAMEKQNLVVDVYAGKADDAAIASFDLSHDLNAVATNADKARNKIQSLGKAYDDYIKKLQSSRTDNIMITGFMQDGTSEKRARMINEMLTAKNADPNAKQTYGALTSDELAIIDSQLASEKTLESITDQRKKQEEDITKEKEKQAKAAAEQKILAAGTNEQTRNMLRVYQALSKTGLDDNAARYFTAEIGRESSFQNKNLFGTHTDANNSQTNRGMISWQKSRATELMSYLKSKGVVDSKGNIKQTQEALDAQAEFLVNELLTTKAYSKSKDAVMSGKGYKELQQTVGNNFIGWDIKANTLSKDNVNSNIKRMDGYRSQLDNLLGSDSGNALSAFSKLTALQDGMNKVREQQEQSRITIDIKFATEPEKLKQEYDELVEQINNAGYDQATLKTRLEQAEQDYQDKLTKRPEVLKRVLDSVTSLESSWLDATGKELEADLQDVEEKWKQPKADLAQLLMSEKDPNKATEYESMLVKIDFIIEKEQLTLRYNDAMKQLDELEALRKQRQETQKLRFESGQISQPQYAEGLKLIDAEMVPQLQTIAEQARVISEQLGDAFSVEKLNAFVVGLTQIDAEFKKFLPTAEQLNERIAGGLTDAIMDFADGTKSAGDAFRQFASDFLREIAQMILKQMMFNMVKSAMGSMGGIGGGIASAIGGAFGGFMDGGHTGYGRRDEVAGVVHKDEWVITKPRTSEPGAKAFLSYFERYGMKGLNKFNGYMNGGLVGAPSIVAPNIPTPKLGNRVAEIAQSSSFNANQNFYLVDDPARILDTLKSSQAQENLVVMMSRDPSKFKSALKIGE